MSERTIQPILTATVRTQAEFYDIDPMNVAWHGNYVRYFEMARRVALEKIDYGYESMKASNYHWPIIELTVRYARPIQMGRPFDVKAMLVEWENRLKFNFEITDAETGTRLTRGYTVQVAVDIKTETMLWETPAILREKLAPFLAASR